MENDLGASRAQSWASRGDKRHRTHKISNKTPKINVTRLGVVTQMYKLPTQLKKQTTPSLYILSVILKLRLLSSIGLRLLAQAVEVFGDSTVAHIRRRLPR